MARHVRQTADSLNKTQKTQKYFAALEHADDGQ